MALERRGSASRESEDGVMEERTLTDRGDVSGWFAKVVMIAAEASGQKISEGRVRILAQDLSLYSREQIEAAFRRQRREGSGFFPSSAELIRFLQASVEDRALMAWESLIRAAAEVGGYRSIGIEDGAAAAALEAIFGSWPEFCAHEQGPELLVKRQAFLARYRDALRSGSGYVRTIMPGALGHTPEDSGYLLVDGTVGLGAGKLLERTIFGDVNQLTDGRGDGKKGEGE
jgi:hypothetical protein